MKIIQAFFRSCFLAIAFIVLKGDTIGGKPLADPVDYPVRPTYLVTIGIAVILGIIAFYMYLKKRRNRSDKVG